MESAGCSIQSHYYLPDELHGGPKGAALRRKLPIPCPNIECALVMPRRSGDPARGRGPKQRGRGRGRHGPRGGSRRTEADYLKSIGSLEQEAGSGDEDGEPCSCIV